MQKILDIMPPFTSPQRMDKIMTLSFSPNAHQVEFDVSTGIFVNVLADGRKYALASTSYQQALREAEWDSEEDYIGYDEF